MSTIKSSTDLCNIYDKISTLCHESHEPVLITQNGHSDLVLMSIETYEELCGKLELYCQLDEGRSAIDAGEKRPLAELITDLQHQANIELSNSHFDRFIDACNTQHTVPSRLQQAAQRLDEEGF